MIPTMYDADSGRLCEMHQFLSFLSSSTWKLIAHNLLIAIISNPICLIAHLATLISSCSKLLTEDLRRQLQSQEFHGESISFWVTFRVSCANLYHNHH